MLLAGWQAPPGGSHIDCLRACGSLFASSRHGLRRKASQRTRWAPPPLPKRRLSTARGGVSSRSRRARRSHAIRCIVALLRSSQPFACRTTSLRRYMPEALPYPVLRPSILVIPCRRNTLLYFVGFRVGRSICGCRAHYPRYTGEIRISSTSASCSERLCCQWSLLRPPRVHAHIVRCFAREPKACTWHEPVRVLGCLAAVGDGSARYTACLPIHEPWRPGRYAARFAPCPLSRKESSFYWPFGVMRCVLSTMLFASNTMLGWQSTQQPCFRGSSALCLVGSTIGSRPCHTSVELCPPPSSCRFRCLLFGYFAHEAADRTERRRAEEKKRHRAVEECRTRVAES